PRPGIWIGGCDGGLYPGRAGRGEWLVGEQHGIVVTERLACRHAGRRGGRDVAGPRRPEADEPITVRLRIERRGPGAGSGAALARVAIDRVCGIDVAIGDEYTSESTAE